MRNFRLLTVISMLVFAAIGMSSPLISIYLEQLGSSLGRISLILASAGLVGLIASYLWGRATDRLGRRRPVIVIGLLGAAAAYALLSRVSTSEVAWATRLVEAAALAAYSTASLAMMGDLLVARAQSGGRGTRMGLYRGIGSLSFAAGAVIGGRLADASSLRSTLAACSVFYVLAAVIAFALREMPAIAQDATRTAPPARARRDRSTLPWPFLAGVFLWMGAHMGASSMWPNYMAQLGYSKSALSSLWGLAALTEAPAMVVVGRLSDLIGRAPLLTAGALGMVGVQLGYIALATILPALIGVQLLRGVSYAAYTTSAMTFAAEAGSRETRGLNSGVFNAAGSAGQLAGLLLGGTLAQARGFNFMFGFFAAAMLLSAVCFILLRRIRPAA